VRGGVGGLGVVELEVQALWNGHAKVLINQDLKVSPPCCIY